MAFNRKKMILEQAVNMFFNYGIQHITMDDIAKKSNMSKGAIYHYYSSKKSLFLALIDHWETYSFPDFYTKNKKNKSASQILKDIAGVVYDVFKKKKHVFLAEIEFWSLANKDEDVKEKSKILNVKITYNKYIMLRVQFLNRFLNLEIHFIETNLFYL